MSGGEELLILSVEIDETAQREFDALRRAYFPPERLVVGAHVTLFHALPGSQLQRIAADLEEVTSATPPAVMRVTGVRFLGRGVAYDLASPALQRVREELAGRWAEHLTRQDRQPFRPHVTVQNKVAPEVARALHARLQAGFVPSPVEARGLLLWRYLGGPWRLEQRRPFRG